MTALPCSHGARDIVQAREGTAYCAACERAAQLTPEELLKLGVIAGDMAARLPLRRAGHAVEDRDGDTVAATWSWAVATELVAICNAFPGLLTTLDARDREIAALREQLDLVEKRAAVPPPREVSPPHRPVKIPNQETLHRVAVAVSDRIMSTPPVGPGDDADDAFELSDWQVRP